MFLSNLASDCIPGLSAGDGRSSNAQDRISLARTQGLQSELFSLTANAGAGVAVVLHDLNLAARYCQRLLLLHQGKVIASGTPAAILTPALLAQVYGIAASYDPDTRTTRIKGKLHSC